MNWAAWFLAAEAAMSAAAYVVYALDKHKARRGAWRIRERTLLLLAFFCGAPGAYLAMKTLRHKTQHRKFCLLVPLFLALQAGALIWLLIN